MPCQLGEDCVGPLWQCRSCGAEFCLDHSHVTGLGPNVECIDCETKRLDVVDADLLKPQAAERILDEHDTKERSNESRSRD